MTHPQGQRQGLISAGFALLFLLAGCASEGPPRPPSLNLPAAVHGLSASRTGDAVDLSWTNPTRTTDGVSLLAKHGAGRLEAEICRAESFPSATCVPMGHMPETAGTAGEFHDTLPSVLAAGDLRKLSYRVRIVNALGRGAAWTQTVTVAGAAPPAVAGLRAYPVAQGIAVQWEPVTERRGDVMLRVTRGDDRRSTLLAADGSSADAASVAPARGTIDTGGHAGQEQHYIVFRRQAVVLDGQKLTLDSASGTVAVAATAKLPLPQPPAGLEAVASTLGAPEIDLVWQPPVDPTVTGYRVYRDEGGVPELLTPQPLSAFSYTDRSVRAGHAYRYIVSSVNDTGESRSAAASAALP